MSETPFKHNGPMRERLHEIIFEADTPAGKWFDISVLIMIIASVIVVMIETVPSLSDTTHNLLYGLEWVFTIFFTMEYILRMYVVHRKMKYATSFFGIIDLASILPAYLIFFGIGTTSLMTIRALRLLRVFRIFKMISFMRQGKIITDSLKASRAKIGIFMFFILIAITITGSLMYLIEGGTNEDFDSIPRSIYWAIVTLTTVGYGDIVPATVLGQMVASFIMIMGYSVIAVPTGIISADMMNRNKSRRRKKEKEITTQVCRYCCKEGHDQDAIFCKYCSEKLNIDKEDKHF